MDQIIRFSCLSIRPDKLEILKSDLEKLIEAEPSEEIKLNAKEMNKSINQRHIFVDGNNMDINYRIDFYYKDEKGTKGHDYLGSIKYSSPVNP